MAMGTYTPTLEALAARVNGDAGLLRRGRFITLEFQLQIGEEAHFLRIEEGRLLSVTPGPLLMRPWCFAIRISREAWPQFCQNMPIPGYHDLFAMCKLGDAAIEGDIHPLMANLRYFKDLLAMARQRSPEAAHGC